MGVLKRASLIFNAERSRILNRSEDPRETLDYAYMRQLETLTQVRRGVADLGTARKRVESQIDTLRTQQAKQEDMARKALQSGREDLAREALGRKAELQGDLDGLDIHYRTVRADEEKLATASRRLQRKVESFRTQKEVIKATYTAAEVQRMIAEMFSDFSERMGDIGMTMRRAQDNTTHMQARAGAVDELMTSDALNDYASGVLPVDIHAELDRMSSSRDIEAELERLKSEIGRNLRFEE